MACLTGAAIGVGSTKGAPAARIGRVTGTEEGQACRRPAGRRPGSRGGLGEPVPHQAGQPEDFVVGRRAGRDGPDPVALRERPVETAVLPQRRGQLLAEPDQAVAVALEAVAEVLDPVRHDQHARRVVGPLRPHALDMPQHAPRGRHLDRVRRGRDQDQRREEEGDGEGRRHAGREVDERHVVAAAYRQQGREPGVELLDPVQRQVHAADRQPLAPRPPIGAALLVVVDERHAKAEAGERAGQIDRQCALAGTALHVADGDDVARTS